MEKSPQELLLDEGVMLEIPEGANESAIEQTIENALDLQPDKLAADMNKVWLQETGEGISEEIQGEIKYKTERVQFYAKRYVSHQSQANLIKYREKVGSLYREIERAKQHAVKHQTKAKHRGVYGPGNTEKSVTRARDSIFSEGTGRQRENEFDRTVRKMGGWQNNQGLKGMLDTLREYNRNKHITGENQIQYYDLNFFAKYVKKYGRAASVSPLRSENIRQLRRGLGQGFDRSFKIGEEWNEFTKAPPRERVDTREVMRGIDPERLAQRQQEKALQKQQDREALLRQRDETQQAKTKYDRAALLLLESKKKQKAADLKARYEAASRASQRRYEQKIPPPASFSAPTTPRLDRYGGERPSAESVDVLARARTMLRSMSNPLLDFSEDKAPAPAQLQAPPPTERRSRERGGETPPMTQRPETPTEEGARSKPKGFVRTREKLTTSEEESDSSVRITGERRPAEEVEEQESPRAQEQEAQEDPELWDPDLPWINFGENEEEARRSWEDFQDETQDELRHFDNLPDAEANKMLAEVARIYLIPFYLKIPLQVDTFYKEWYMRYGEFDPPYFQTIIGASLKEHLRHKFKQQHFEPENFAQFFTKSSEDATQLWDKIHQITPETKSGNKKPWEDLTNRQQEEIERLYFQSLKRIGRDLRECLSSINQVGILKDHDKPRKQQGTVYRKQREEILKQFDLEGPFQEQLSHAERNLRDTNGATVSVGYDVAAIRLEQDLREDEVGWEDVRNRTFVYAPRGRGMGFIPVDDYLGKKTQQEQFDEAARKGKEKAKFEQTSEEDTESDSGLGTGVSGELTEPQELYNFVGEKIQKLAANKRNKLDAKQLAKEFYRKHPHRMGKKTRLDQQVRAILPHVRKYQKGRKAQLGRGRNDVYPILGVPSPSLSPESDTIPSPSPRRAGRPDDEKAEQEHKRPESESEIEDEDMVGYDFSGAAQVDVVHEDTPVVPKPKGIYKTRSKGIAARRSGNEGWEIDKRTGRRIAYHFSDGSSVGVPDSPAELDAILASGKLGADERLYNMFRDIMQQNMEDLGSVGSRTGRRMRRGRRLSFQSRATTSSDESQDTVSSYVGRPRRPQGINRPVGPRSRRAQRRAVVGGLAGVRAGRRRGVPPAHYQLPVDPQQIRLLMHARYQPRGQDPSSTQLLTFTESEEPGHELYSFKRNARRDDPFYAMGCHVGARKHEIGDYILMCVEPEKVNIVIYRLVTRGAIKILVKKLRHHLKGKQFVNSKLSYFGGQELFSRTELLKTAESELVRKLFSIAKSNTFTRLILENSSGGPLSQEWFHTYRAHRHI